MICIKGTYAKARIFSETLDSGSEGLITALCSSILAENSKIRIMPDVHPGKGCAVGMTMTLDSRAAPGLVGVDIGCGMSVTRIRAKNVELQKLDKLVHAKIPAGFSIRETPHRFAEEARLEELRCVRHIRREKALCGVGTLGGGNHFIELDRANDGYCLIVHSGSRHLGVEVERFYHDLAYEQTKGKVPYEFAYLEGTDLADYLHDMEIVQEYAAINRRAIADGILKGMKFSAVESFETVHNYIDVGEKILRKGAVSAKRGERIVIPLNMRDGCLICEGKGNPDWNCSAPHGAGRLCSRSDALASFTLSQYKKEMKGVYSSSVSRDTLDECPMAYKDPEMLIRAIEPTAVILEHTTPVYNFKAGAGDRD